MKVCVAKIRSLVLALGLGLTLGLPGIDALANDQSGSDAEELLAVGPGIIQSDENGTWITVLGQKIVVDMATNFPRGLIEEGDYVAVEGQMAADGNAIASSIVRLGGRYSPGNSPVYLRGIVTNLNDAGSGTVGNAIVDLAGAFYNPDLLTLTDKDLIEVLGFEGPTSNLQIKVVAIEATLLKGITGSGLKGITGSGLKGITGSGLKGITGSGLKGITGSGLKGITAGSEARALDKSRAK